MDYEYALLEKQRNRHINCSPGRDHNVDYRRAHSTERSSDDSAALLPTMRCQLQEASLSSVSCQLRGQVKEDAVHHHGRREDNGRAWILFLGPDEIWCCTSTWVDTCARMVGMVVQEGISAGSLEVGMDEVGKAHGTSVGTLLEVDGRAFTDGYVDTMWMWMLMGMRMQMVRHPSWVSRNLKYKQTTFLITESPIVRINSRANNCPISKDSY